MIKSSAEVDNLENQSRRCNLVFYGVNESDNAERNADSERKILELCESKLGLRNLSIGRAHRLGRFQSGKNRPLIASFTLYKEKQLILENARKLKNSQLAISEDFSNEVRAKRKQLWDFAKSRRKDGDKVSLQYDTLLFNGTKYVYNSELNQVVSLK